MALQDPISVYTPGNNVEAHMICGWLEDRGVPAFAMDDQSLAGTWLLGLLPQVHKPKIWVERSDAEKAKTLLAQYEEELIARQEKLKESPLGTEPISVVCEECGQTSEFPSNERGTIQNCPHCRAYIDVGDMDLGGEFAGEEPGGNDDPEPGT